MHTIKLKNGFTALVAVLLISFGAVALALSTLGAAVLYENSISNRELRIQARLNAQSCIDIVGIMSGKNPFFAGTSSIAEFGCEFEIRKDLSGKRAVTATTTLEGVKWAQ